MQKLSRLRMKRLFRIGYFAVCAYNADLKRKDAQSNRRIARSKNPCTNETCDYVNGEPENFRPQPCWMDEHLGKNEWCEGCNTVQPYHEVYIKSAKESSIAKARLTNAIKKYKSNPVMEIGEK
jgi:hypothetical protein